jgi:hypothetical protein
MQNYASSIRGAVLRISRLNADGTIATGASASYVTSRFISVSFTPEYEEGEEITQRAADGSICATFKGEDTLTRITMELSICEPDIELTEMVSGGTLLAQGGTNIGYKSPLAGVNASPNGIAVEVWSNAISNGRVDGTYPYFHWVFPSVHLRPSGDRVIENGLMAVTFEGFGDGNLNFGDGPAGTFPFPTAVDAPYVYIRTASAPVGQNGYVAVS